MKLNASKWNQIEQEIENQCDFKCSPCHHLQNMLYGGGDSSQIRVVLFCEGGSPMAHTCIIFYLICNIYNYLWFVHIDFTLK
jgi:hypothetical protein